MATFLTYYNHFSRGIIFLGLIAYGQTLAAQGKAPAPTTKRALAFADEAQLRQAVYDTAATFIGKTERTGRNDATWIASINRFSHLPKTAHYCASAFFYCHAKNGVVLAVRGVGMVRSYFGTPKTIIYKKNQRGNQRIGQKIQRMDAVSLFASHIEGIAQDRYDPEVDDRVKCIGFNTSGGRGTKDGCYVNWRKTSEIKAIANWITPYCLANPSIFKPL